MGQAIVDPAELRRFALQLRQFNNDLLNQMTVVHGQLLGLGQSWRDREHDKFVEEFEQTLTVIKHFVETIEVSRTDEKSALRVLTCGRA
jgi:uncharacterized protein YukE